MAVNSQSTTQPTVSIAVGSQNPVKVNAVSIATSKTWPLATIVGYDVASGVSAQPFSDQETLQGAVNRAKAALAAQLKLATSTEQTGVVLGVGLEGGVMEQGEQLWSTVWAVVVDQTGEQFTANGARFQVPEQIAASLKAGEEMGPVVASLVGVKDVRSKQGMIGIITDNFVTRTEEYSGIIKLALGLWYGRNWKQNIAIKQRK